MTAVSAPTPIRDAVIDLRHETVLAIARCGDMLDRIAERRDPAQENRQ